MSRSRGRRRGRGQGAVWRNTRKLEPPANPVWFIASRLSEQPRLAAWSEAEGAKGLSPLKREFCNNARMEVSHSLARSGQVTTPVGRDVEDRVDAEVDEDLAFQPL